MTHRPPSAALIDLALRLDAAGHKGFSVELARLALEVIRAERELDRVTKALDEIVDASREDVRQARATARRARFRLVHTGSVP